MKHYVVVPTLVLALIAAASGPVVGEPLAASFLSGDVEIHYQVEGEGSPVLLIHGYRAQGNMNWRFPGVNGALSDRYQVITIDNRGHGKSGRPTDPASYGREMVEDQVRLLDHLGIEKAHVVGYSMGGMITLRMAVDHPDRMLSAAVCGMGWTKDDEATKARYQARGEVEDENVKPEHRAVVASWWELGVSEQDLQDIEVPLTVIVGDQDGLYESSVKPLVQARPNTPLSLIEGGSHASTLLKRDFHVAVRSWIDENSSP